MCSTHWAVSSTQQLLQLLQAFHNSSSRLLQGQMAGIQQQQQEEEEGEGEGVVVVVLMRLGLMRS